MPISLKRGGAGNVVTGSLGAVGQADPVQVGGLANCVVSGNFVASVRLACSFDAGGTWIPVTSADGSVRLFAGPERIVIEEPEDGVLYRVECLSWTSGIVNWRLSK